MYGNGKWWILVCWIWKYWRSKCDISNINLKVVKIKRKWEVERAKGNGLVENRIGWISITYTFYRGYDCPQSWSLKSVNLANFEKWINFKENNVPALHFSGPSLVLLLKFWSWVKCVVSKTLSAVSNDSGTYCLLGIKCLLECISETAVRFAKFYWKLNVNVFCDCFVSVEKVSYADSENNNV